MKTLSVVATTLLLLTIAAPLATPAAAADDVAVSPAASSVKESVVVDCSKEVWPDFSPSWDGSPPGYGQSSANNVTTRNLESEKDR